MRLRAPTALAVTLGLGLVALTRADEPKPAELPVTRVVLFSSGVGHYTRAGKVSGSARVDLQFPEAAINDLLKSLVLEDRGGGKISAVSYDSRNPLEKTLKSFAIDLTGNPSMGDLLQQVRGERVEVFGTQTAGLTGLIVGVEQQKQATEKGGTAEVSHLNLLTAEGLQGMPLNQVRRVRFVKPELEQEFRKALEVMALGRDRQKKAVSLSFQGRGERPVRVGYLMESPMWKTTYRLELGEKDKVFLQGWAIVENTTDDDWSNVRLSLVSGRPISYRMDLYEPLFVPRPLVEPEIFASLRPRNYSGDMQAEAVPLPIYDSRNPSAKASPPPAKNGRPFEPSLTSGQFVPKGYLNNPSPRRVAGESSTGSFMLGVGVDVGLDRDKPTNYGIDRIEDVSVGGPGVSSAAAGVSLGDAFSYAIEEPVTLPRQKSALIPIVNQEVTGQRVSIYNAAVLAKHPLLGLRFHNATALHLMQGPVTVFDGANYAGDARLADLKPKESRLLSYAVDLGTEVEAKIEQQPAVLQSVKIARGAVVTLRRMQRKTKYVVKNRSEQARTIIVEHPYQPEWKLVKPEKSAERSRGEYRFELSAAPDKPAELEVVEERDLSESFAILNSGDEALQVFLKAPKIGEKVKVALEKALELRGKGQETERLVALEEKNLAALSKDQERMRANLQRLPPTSDAYKRYLKKFDEQEPDIEARQKRLAQLQDQGEQQRKAYETYLAALSVE